MLLLAAHRVRIYRKCLIAPLNIAKSMVCKGSEDSRINESSSLLLVGKDSKKAAQRNGTFVKAALYAVQVFYSFFIM
jgi:solute carrier family 31 (copper transporter), member 1